MIVLGIASEHCSSASLMVDGEIIGLIQEERLTRRKNQVAFPLQAIRRLIDNHLTGDSLKIDHVVFGGQLSHPFYAALDRFSNFSVAQYEKEQHELWYPHFYENKPADGSYWLEQFREGENINLDVQYDFSWLRDMSIDDAISHFVDVERPAAVRRHLRCRDDIVISSIDHHTCHAYYAICGGKLDPGQLEDALVLTADGWGDGCNWSASVVDAEGCLKRVGGGVGHTVARIYKWATLILGMKPNEHEYKVMGLSAYATHAGAVKEAESVLFRALDFRNGDFVSAAPLVDSYFDLKNRLEGVRFDVFAAALQNWATALCKAWVKHWLEKTGRRGVCFSGGLSMNIKTNGEILEMPEVDWLSVPASGGDESISAGACFALINDINQVRTLRHTYLGDIASDEGWASRLGETDYTADRFGIRDNFGPEAVAQLLADDNIVARCMGPAEFGARSLGNRSILANPSNPKNVKLINDSIKNRDFWMPFTPSILAEHVDRYLENPKKANCPYMTIGFSSKPKFRHEISAAAHPAYFSVRPQFVERETNPDYWELIELFRKLTGIPALLTTSLNRHGEPMNYTTADAVRTLALSDLNFLLMPDNKLLYKLSAKSNLDLSCPLITVPRHS